MAVFALGVSLIAPWCPASTRGTPTRLAQLADPRADPPARVAQAVRFRTGILAPADASPDMDTYAARANIIDPDLLAFIQA